MSAEEMFLYATGGIGDFARTWPVIRHILPGRIVINQRWRGLAREVFGEIETLDVSEWKSFIEGDTPPPALNGVLKMCIFIHKVTLDRPLKDNDRRKTLEGLIARAAPKVAVEWRHYTKEHCSGINAEPCLESSTDKGLFHVGAAQLKFYGAPPNPFPDKTWKLRQSLEFADAMAENKRPLTLIAGPNQEEQWTDEEMNIFLCAGGSIGEDLVELVRQIKAAAYFVGFDSGPTHIAAQLGKPTIGIYGPTGQNFMTDYAMLGDCDPDGPLVEVIFPPPGTSDADKPNIAWLSPQEAVRRVVAALDSLMTP